MLHRKTSNNSPSSHKNHLRISIPDPHTSLSPTSATALLSPTSKRPTSPATRTALASSSQHSTPTSTPTTATIMSATLAKISNSIKSTTSTITNSTTTTTGPIPVKKNDDEDIDEVISHRHHIHTAHEHRALPSPYRDSHHSTHSHDLLHHPGSTVPTPVVSSTVIIVASIIAWYIFSVSISLYNKWMFNPNLNFSYPILITSCHQFILFLLSGSVLLSTKKFRFADAKQTYMMNYRVYLFQILPCSLSSAADIGLGNYSFKFITLSLYTMVKSSAIVFVLTWGVIFKLEKFSLRLCIIVAIMTVGVTMMVYGQHDQEGTTQTDPDKIFVGTFLVLSSACMSGLRWALTQILLKKNTYTKNPILTIFYISPSMCLTLVIFGGFIEGWRNFATADIWHERGFLVTIILLIIPGVLAFLMTLSEFTLLQHASLLTLSIAGIFKEILTISISSMVFGDRLNLLNIFGLVITLGDIMWYNYYRYEESKNIPVYDKLSTTTEGTRDDDDDIELRTV